MNLPNKKLQDILAKHKVSMFEFVLAPGSQYLYILRTNEPASSNLRIEFAEACGPFSVTFEVLPEIAQPTLPGFPPSQVNHPDHYNTGKIEVIEFIEDQGFGKDFCRGNAIKYLARAGKKDTTKELEDLEKAAWYLDREILSLRVKNGIEKGDIEAGTMMSLCKCGGVKPTRDADQKLEQLGGKWVLDFQGRNIVFLPDHPVRTETDVDTSIWVSVQ